MSLRYLPLPGFTEPRLEGSPRLVPFLKWPGGKSQELPAIAAAAPPLTGRLIDPFVGGGAILLATPVEVPAWANDVSPDLIAVYVAAASREIGFRRAADAIAGLWNDLGALTGFYSGLAESFSRGLPAVTSAVVDRSESTLRSLVAAAGPGLATLFLLRLERDLLAKFDRMRKVEARAGVSLPQADLLANVEGAVRSALYVSVRSRYNRARLTGTWDPVRLADFLFLREFTFAAMFRFNARDEFNVPYGGITYNRKSLQEKVRLLFSEQMSARLSNTEWRRGDFEPFLAEASPGAEDLVFVDPPYDSEFSDYDNRGFGWQDQRRLREALETLPARVMIVIKDTPMVRRLYRSARWRTIETDKTYMWTIKSRNDRAATHLTITNY